MKAKQTALNEIITYLNSGHCPYAVSDEALLLNADSLKLLKQFPSDSIDACVSDGPFGIGIMGKEWDNFKPKALSNQSRNYQQGKDHKLQSGRSPSMHAGQYDMSRRGAIRFQEWCCMWATELYRVLKPGAYILMFCSPRMYHRLVCGVEDAGFQIRDTLMWLFGEGFPKSKNICRCIKNMKMSQQRKGWGTALKPAHEPILLVQKPYEGTYANNVLQYGVGGLNIDGGRIDPASKDDSKRFPSNVIIDDDAAKQLGAKSRYFYSPKISEKERHAGCKDLPFENAMPKGGSRTYEDYCGNCGKKFVGSEDKRCHCPGGEKITQRPQKTGNIHPTGKPISLMEYLVKMIVPPQGICLDIFMGSGSTGIACSNLGMGRQFIGIDIEKDYFEIAKARLRYWAKHKKSA
jgi:site-specific DNA-methyltransferase (adenine-specific)